MIICFPTRSTLGRVGGYVHTISVRIKNLICIHAEMVMRWHRSYMEGTFPILNPTLLYPTLPFLPYPTLPFFAPVFSYPACHPPHITSLKPFKVLPVPSHPIALPTRRANKYSRTLSVLHSLPYPTLPYPAIFFMRGG